jgi:hypothetical protein
VPDVCNDYGATVYANGCGVTNDPALKDEQTARLVAKCADALAAPGMNASTATPALTACLEQMKTAPSCVVKCSFGAAGGGTLDAGAPCLYSGQCRGYCKLSAPATCGVCADPIAQDQPCVAGGVDDQCAAGTECKDDGTFKNWACRHVPVAGERCGVVGEPGCAAGLVCGMGASGGFACVAGGPAAAGAACKMENDCAQGLVCGPSGGSASSMTCQNVVFAGEGEACGNQTIVCAHDLYCNGGKCVSLTFVDPGATCDATHACKRGFCMGSEGTGMCPAVKEAGEACGDLEPCDSYLECISGTCAIPDPSTCH